MNQVNTVMKRGVGITGINRTVKLKVVHGNQALVGVKKPKLSLIVGHSRIIQHVLVMMNVSGKLMDIVTRKVVGSMKTRQIVRHMPPTRNVCGILNMITVTRRGAGNTLIKLVVRLLIVRGMNQVNTVMKRGVGNTIPRAHALMNQTV